MLALAAGGALGAGPDDLPTCGSEEMAHTGEFTPYDYSAVGFMLVVSLGIGKYNPDYSSFLVFNFSATAPIYHPRRKSIVRVDHLGIIIFKLSRIGTNCRIQYKGIATPTANS